MFPGAAISGWVIGHRGTAHETGKFREAINSRYARRWSAGRRAAERFRHQSVLIDVAGLKRFSFFVSRRREESRERFRLHMGYFETQEEAEKLLDIVREIYPGAWAGLAPGQRLRAAAAQSVAAPAPTSAAEVAPAQLEPSLDATPAAADAADAATSADTGADVSDAATTAAAAATTAAIAGDTVSVSIKESALLDAAALALVPDEGRRIPEGQILKAEIVAAARSLNDVRAAIASLDDTSEGA